MRSLLLGAALMLLAACTSASSGSRPPAGPVTIPGVRDVRLLAPAESGAGAVPTFRWSPVAGATRYRLAVLDAGSRPIWAWEGAATSVRLGGLSVDRPRGRSGPIVTPGSSWLVVALDAEGHVIAVSAQRPVAP